MQIDRVPPARIDPDRKSKTPRKPARPVRRTPATAAGEPGPGNPEPETKRRIDVTA